MEPASQISAQMKVALPAKERGFGVGHGEFRFR